MIISNIIRYAHYTLVVLMYPVTDQIYKFANINFAKTPGALFSSVSVQMLFQFRMSQRKAENSNASTKGLLGIASKLMD